MMLGQVLSFTRIYLANKYVGPELARKELICRNAARTLVSAVHRDIGYSLVDPNLPPDLKRALKLLQPGDELLTFSWSDFGRAVRRIDRINRLARLKGASVRVLV